MRAFSHVYRLNLNTGAVTLGAKDETEEHTKYQRDAMMMRLLTYICFTSQFMLSARHKCLGLRGVFSCAYTHLYIISSYISKRSICTHVHKGRRVRALEHMIIQSLPNRTRATQHTHTQNTRITHPIHHAPRLMLLLQPSNACTYIYTKCSSYEYIKTGALTLSLSLVSLRLRCGALSSTNLRATPRTLSLSRSRSDVRLSTRYHSVTGGRRRQTANV